MLRAPLLCLLWGVASAAAGPAQHDLTESWRWREFTAEDGLPSNRINAICEADDGTVWVSTFSGLACFDGFRWRAMGPAQGLPRKDGAAVSADDSRGVLVVMDSELYRGDQSGFSRVSLPAEGAAHRVVQAAPLGRNALLLLTRDRQTARFGLFRLEQDSLTRFPGPDDAEPYTLWRTSGNDLFICASAGVYRWREGRWEHRMAIPTEPGRIPIPTMRGSVQEDEVLLWIDHPQSMRGIWQSKAGGPPSLSLKAEYGSPAALAAGPDATVIEVHDSGAVQIRRDDTWSQLDNIPPQLASARCMRFQSNGDLWVGTDHGLFVYQATSRLWEHWKNPAADSGNRVHEIIETGDGSIWIASSDGVEIRTPDGRVERITEIDGVSVRNSTGLAVDGAGNVWLTSGAAYQGAFRFDGSTWSYFGPQQGLTGVRHKVRTDRRGRPWFLGLGSVAGLHQSEGGGAAVYLGDRFEHWTTANGLLHDRVYAFAEGHQGELWFGTWAGLSRCKNGEWTHWTADDGLRDERIWALAVDDDDTLWFSDRLCGLGSIRADSPCYLSIDDEAVSNEVWDIRSDPLGGIWASCRGGAIRLNDGRRYTFPARDGIGRLNLWPILATNHRVLIGTLGAGTAVLDRDELERSVLNVEVAEPLISDRAVTLGWHAAARQAHIGSHEIDTRYRLDHGEWSKWSLARQATVDVGPGRHAVTVQARSRLAESPLAAHEFSFAVPVPIYRHPLVLTLTAATLLVLASSTVLVTVRRRQHDRAQRESEERFRQIAENSNQVYWLTDWKKGELLYVNPAYERVFGRSCQSLYENRRSWIDAIHPQDRDRVDEVFARKGKRGEYTDEEYRIVGPDGSLRWVHDRSFPIRDAAGEVYRWVGVAEDVTERKRAESALRVREEQLANANRMLQLVLDAIPVRVFWKDRDHYYLGCNRLLARDAGLDDPQELVGRDDFAMVWRDRAERYRADDRKVMETLQPKLNYEEPQTTPDGRTIWLQTSKIPLQDGKGNVVGVLGTYEDITDRKRAEEALRLTQFSVDRTADSVFWMGPDARFAYVNDAACRMLGYSRQELLHMTVHDVDPGFPPEIWPAHWSEIRDRGSFTVESRNRAKDGRVFPVEITVNFLEFEGKEYNCAYVRDITDRKRAEEALIESEEKYRRVFEESRDAIYISSPAGRLLDINEAGVRLFGYASKEEVLDVDIARDLFVDPQDRLSSLRAVAERGFVQDLELRVKDRQGNELTVLETATAVRDDAGKV
ncbi:MAG TPA: PAS domain S-box protein, partial [Phycisphaerae bacterium]|nr:PAS domain S-box protein [Phycisphaerae bacterium]